MDFDIQALYDDELSEDEERFDAFQDALLDRFYHTPEWIGSGGKAEEEGFWAAHFVYYVNFYVGVPLAKVDADDADEVISDLFPREIILMESEETENALPELMAFWRFLKREFSLENADSVLQYLESMDPEEFTEAMLDPDNFGIDKAFLLASENVGVNMTNADEVDEFRREYNADLLSDDLPEDDSPVRGRLLSDNPPPVRLYLADEVKKKKNKRKQAKASRKKNRKK